MTTLLLPRRIPFPFPLSTFASLLSTFAFAAALTLGGCSLFQTEETEPLLLAAWQDSPALRPGDPLQVEIALISRTAKKKTSPPLNASTLTFWFTEEDGGRVVKRTPVVSSREPKVLLEEIEPGRIIRRRFVFTQAAETTGTFHWQAVLGAPGGFGAASGLSPVYSTAMNYTVRGARAWRRDNDGILLRDDAQNIARRWAGLPGASAQATLVRNEAGFLDWWIRLIPPGAAAPSKACLINPYLAEFRAEVNPASVPPRAAANQESESHPAPIPLTGPQPYEKLRPR